MRMTTVQSLPERGKTLHAAMLPGKSGVTRVREHYDTVQT